MKLISSIDKLINRNDIIGTWCFQVLQCAVVQSFIRFGKQSLDKGLFALPLCNHAYQNALRYSTRSALKGYSQRLLETVYCYWGIVGVVAPFLDSLYNLIQIVLIQKT